MKDIIIDGYDPINRTIVYPEDWIVIGEFIHRLYKNYDGFVITLGTDTLAYLSSALSLFCLNPAKPIIITGAMKPISYRGSDACGNLNASILVAAKAGRGGIFVVFNKEIFAGDKVSKIHSEDIGAFACINYPHCGKISNNKVIWRRSYKKTSDRFTLAPYLDTRVISVKLTPNLKADYFKGFEKYRGILIEGYGDGNVSDDLVPVLKRLAKKSVMVLASQCPYGKVSHKYEGGDALICAGAISAAAMTKETALVKLMWVLGQTKNNKLAREMMGDEKC